MVDLHLHSSASDGRHPPEVVVQLAAQHGLDVIALTDHDTTAGVERARHVGDAAGVRVISGCEFSVGASWGEMHLLGYFLPPEHPELDRFLAVQREKRETRAAAIVRRLRDLGVRVTVEQVMVEADGGAIGRPHVARALVRHGVTSDVQDAFRRYLGWGRPAFVAKDLRPVETVTRLIRDVGGISSAAHLGDRGTRHALKTLKAEGLDAVEVLHPGHDARTAQRIDSLAENLGLLRTGGSDWHGEDDAAADRAGLGSVVVPEPWLDALDALRRERNSRMETGR